MTLKEQMAADASAVFLNVADFAESAEYNGKTITVIPEIGEGESKNANWDSERSAQRAVFTVSCVDVPDPQVGDVIMHAGREWNFAFIVETDGAMSTLQCTGDESAVILGR